MWDSRKGTDPDAQELAEIQSEYEGFSITCKECGSQRVALYSDAGYSPTSGGWGGYWLECIDCRNDVELWSMS